MLDAFIIDKIRREEDRRDGDQIPLRIEISRERQQDAVVEAETEDRQDRGIAIIDFTI